MAEKTIIKEIKWTETEKTIYGPYEFRCTKTFETRSDCPERVIETTTKNGVITYSASYPLDSDYARMRMA